MKRAKKINFKAAKGVKMPKASAANAYATGAKKRVQSFVKSVK